MAGFHETPSIVVLRRTAAIALDALLVALVAAPALRLAVSQPALDARDRAALAVISERLHLGASADSVEELQRLVANVRDAELWIGSAAPSIRSLMTDFEERNRSQGVVSARTALDTLTAVVVASRLTAEAPLAIDAELQLKEIVRTLHEALVAALDDGLNSVRIAACSGLQSAYSLLVSLGGSPPFDLQTALQAVFIHLDDPEEAVAHAVAEALERARPLDPLKFNEVGESEMKRSRHPARVQQLIR